MFSTLGTSKQKVKRLHRATTVIATSPMGKFPKVIIYRLTISFKPYQCCFHDKLFIFSKKSTQQCLSCCRKSKYILMRINAIVISPIVYICCIRNSSGNQKFTKSAARYLNSHRKQVIITF